MGPRSVWNLSHFRLSPQNKEFSLPLPRAATEPIPHLRGESVGTQTRIRLQIYKRQFNLCVSLTFTVIFRLPSAGGDACEGGFRVVLGVGRGVNGYNMNSEETEVELCLFDQNYAESGVHGDGSRFVWVDRDLYRGERTNAPRPLLLESHFLSTSRSRPLDLPPSSLSLSLSLSRITTD